jgi:hypothetical protein
VAGGGVEDIGRDAAWSGAVAVVLGAGALPAGGLPAGAAESGAKAGAGRLTAGGTVRWDGFAGPSESNAFISTDT